MFKLKFKVQVKVCLPFALITSTDAHCKDQVIFLLSEEIISIMCVRKTVCVDDRCGP